VIRRQQRSIAALLSFLLLAACASLQQHGATGHVSPASDAASAVYSAPSDARRRADAHLQLALAYYQQTQWQVALDEVTLALRAMPQLPDALSMRGLIYMASGRRDLAGADFRQALQIAPEQPDYLNNYAWFLCQDGHAQESLDWFERAVGKPDYRSPWKALNNAGSCSLAAGDRRLAEAYFLRAAAVQAGNVRSNIELAKLYFNDGDFPRARFHAERAMAVATPGVEALWLAIKVARKSDQPETEAKLLTQLRLLYPDSAEYAAYQRGVFDE
jgi:type IV pilus assembly protein PilF